MVLDRVREMLLRHEGLRLKPYKDTMGKLSIGVGRNLDDVGITQLEAMLLLANDLDRVNQQVVNTFAWFKSLDTVRQDVVICMVFNLGIGTFQNFKNLIAALVSQKYDIAADEMLNSHWAGQVGERAKELAQVMRSGRYISVN